MPTEQMLAPRNREYLGLRVSDKKDLTRVEILMVVSLLIYNDSIYYFLQNCHLICKDSVPFAALRTGVCKDSVELSVTAALHDFLKSN
jgi:hypothetical protein